MSKRMTERIDKIEQSARETVVGITRNLTMVRLPKPVRITNLEPWKAETLRDPVAMKAFSKDGIETHKLNSMLIPPALTKHIQCGDWSDIGNTGGQVRPCTWSRFNMLTAHQHTQYLFNTLLLPS